MAQISSGTLGDLLNKLYSDYGSGKGKGLGELEGVKDLYGPEYLKGAETEALAGIEQSFVGRGLSNTTLPVSASIGMKRKFQDERLRGKAGAMTNIADFISKFFPSPATLSHLATGGFSGTQQANQFAASQPQIGNTYGGFSSFPSLGTYGTLGRSGGGGASGGSAGTGGTGGSGGSGGGSYSTPSMPVYGSSYGGSGGSNEAKRLADEAQARKLQAAGRLTFDPAQFGGGGTTNPTVSSVGSAAPTGSTGTSTGPAHVQSFQDYFNYSATLYNKTGEKLSPQAAYSKLLSTGWKG